MASNPFGTEIHAEDVVAVMAELKGWKIAIVRLSSGVRSFLSWKRL
ncbi:hypothetical protein JCM19235_3926 [Vibrio maritimus]|uniref:Uncharacterized protein n=1 Tax=Vibrio maritimus TaxID=990268 RepID=A0A090S3X5_9VIBR|nr:hypothetical protein JCM19235_3926 [Vibrio maritimus]